MEPLCSASCFARQSCFRAVFFHNTCPSMRVQNELADADNRETQRGICLHPHILHSDNEQELPMHKCYLPTTALMFPAISDAYNHTKNSKNSLIIYKWSKRVFLYLHKMGKVFTTTNTSIFLKLFKLVSFALLL